VYSTKNRNYTTLFADAIHYVVKKNPPVILEKKSSSKCKENKYIPV
jgi:hypothetical protein